MKHFVRRSTLDWKILCYNSRSHGSRSNQESRSVPRKAGTPRCVRGGSPGDGRTQRPAGRCPHQQWQRTREISSGGRPGSTKAGTCQGTLFGPPPNPWVLVQDFRFRRGSPNAAASHAILTGTVDYTRIIRELRAEAERLDRAIRELESLTAGSSVDGGPKRRGRTTSIDHHDSSDQSIAVLPPKRRAPTPLNTNFLLREFRPWRRQGRGPTNRPIRIKRVIEARRQEDFHAALGCERFRPQQCHRSARLIIDAGCAGL